LRGIAANNHANGVSFAIGLIYGLLAYHRALAQ
jgi:hypothetical protein